MNMIDLQEKTQQFAKIAENMRVLVERVEATVSSIKEKESSDQEFLLKLSKLKQQIEAILNTLNTSIENTNRVLLFVGIKDYGTFPSANYSDQEIKKARSNDNSCLLSGFWKMPEVAQVKSYRLEFHRLLKRALCEKKSLEEKINLSTPTLSSLLNDNSRP